MLVLSIQANKTWVITSSSSNFVENLSVTAWITMAPSLVAQRDTKGGQNITWWFQHYMQYSAAKKSDNLLISCCCCPGNETLSCYVYLNFDTNHFSFLATAQNVRAVYSATRGPLHLMTLCSAVISRCLLVSSFMIRLICLSNRNTVNFKKLL